MIRAFLRNFNKAKVNIARVLFGDLSKVHYYFNGGQAMRTRDHGYTTKKNLRIGKYTFIGDFVTIGPNAKEIGSYTSIAPGVSIGNNIHPIHELSTSAVFYAKRWGNDSDEFEKELNSKSTVVGHDVWIGNNAVIMPGVTLGTGCIVGAGSIVTKDVDPFEIVVGVPAKPIKKRFKSSICQSILESRWWESSLEGAKEYYRKFNSEGEN